ncbi:unnamed protein product [Kuraishia capsulata CBS 1993]|uniref:Uncharacterized protein n=1 Tax=Kuraishia capsulata CBS 1993 TaxID=1382522 RepID=W6MHX1_9ASCO|nr:uncharacterized protein KUCA_T00001925001 [Kuraishia capsulata CBS 1993]CDK25954.1 unnamed protein product [Kuraishia capsulata CBS 1993]
MLLHMALGRRFFATKKKLDLTGTVNLIAKAAAEASEGTRMRLQRRLFDDAQEVDPSDYEIGPATEYIPRDSALEYLPKQDHSDEISSILAFQSTNANLLKQEMQFLLPHPLERKFEPEPPIRFDFIRGRHHESLDFSGAYFLAFENDSEAAAYWIETRGSLLEGKTIDLRFVKFADVYKHMFTPILPYINGEVLSSRETLNELDPSFLKLRDGDIGRNKCAIIRGLPTKLTKAELIDELWEFKLHPNEDLAIQKIERRTKNGAIQTGRPSDWVIAFDNSLDPSRFAKRYHHRRFFPSKPDEICQVELL